MRIRYLFVVAIAAIVSLAAAPARADLTGTWNPAGGVIIRGTVLTQDGAHTVIENGRVCVRGNKIEAVLTPAQALPAAFATAPVIDTNGVILPGLINAHNHIAYNFIEMWEAPKLYQNRYQWTGPTKYKLDINFPKKIVCEPEYLNMSIEACKYAEIKELAGGTTAVQGAPPSGSGFNKMLVRNIDFGLDIDDIYQHGLAITDGRFQAEVVAGAGIAATMQNGKTAAWLVHLAEGIDEASRAEFDILKRIGLLREQTVIIHGTALGPNEFRQMAAVGTDLVWSPLSNRLLYGKTTDVIAARAAGVNVSLASDWSPSGSKNLLGELKIADEIDNNEWGNKLSYRDLVDMVTINPAKALHWDDQVGQIKAGYYADIVVIDKRGDPYASVVHATERNVALVMIGGDPLYGDERYMRFLKGSDVETLYHAPDRRKLVDVTKPSEVKGTQTLDQIVTKLSRALAFVPGDMRIAFRDTATMTPDQFQAFLGRTFPGLVPVRLDPIFAEEDPRFFEVIRLSVNARFPYDLRGYWNRATQPIASPVMGIGTIGNAIKAGGSSPMYAEPQGRLLSTRIPFGTSVEILDYRLVTALSAYYKVRATVGGRVVEGWVFHRNVVRS